MIKFKLSRENKIFGKPAPAAMSLNGFWQPKEGFSDNMDSDFNEKGLSDIE